MTFDVPNHDYMVQHRRNVFSQSRFTAQFLRKKCSDGLGEKKFTRALMLLRSMQEGDCKVTVEGVEYDGNEDGDVRIRVHYRLFL